MHDFHYDHEELYCEDVPVRKIADEVGTPFYLYSNHTLENHFTVFDSSFDGTDHLTCFSVKANSNLAKWFFPVWGNRQKNWSMPYRKAY
jgi:diaminopimelate decarboxylase